MRRPLMLLMAGSVLGACGDASRPMGVAPIEEPALPTFAIRSDSDLDSLFRGPKITAEEARAWGEVLADTIGLRTVPASSPVVLGRMRTGRGSVCLLLREPRLPEEEEGKVGEVLLVEIPGNGGKVVRRSLAGYGMSDWWKAICSVEWQAPILRVRDQTQWITEQDSLLRFHIAQRSVLIELRITDHVQVIRQDTTTVIRDLDESGHILPHIKRKVQ